MKLLICAPDIFSGDAVGNHCLGLARTARRLGLDVQLYAQGYDAGTPDIRPFDDLFARASKDDIVLLSYSIYEPFLERLLKLDCRKICYFHGVTDPQLLRDLEPRTAKFCEMALAQLPLLARFDTVIANSDNTAKSISDVLNSMVVKIIPPVFADMPAFRREPAVDRHVPAVPNMLVVGRVVPHKRIEDAIDILALLQQHKLDATLSIVGSSPNYEYLKFLINHARKLGVLGRVDFKGMLDDADLFECYDRASVLLAMSRHEGFCVPVLEAMHFGKPVFVRGGTAAQEICLANCVFPSEESLDVWASAISNPINGLSTTRQIDSAYTSHAHNVLLRADDSVWRAILVDTDVTGETHDRS